MKRILIPLAAAAVLALAGCASAPTSTGESAALQRVAVQVAVGIAVERTVTRDNASQAEIQARAMRILVVVNSLKALGADSLSTLPLVKAALAPQLDKLNLSPFERRQADILVTALVTAGLQRVDASEYIAKVSWLLDEIAADASAYLPAPASTRMRYTPEYMTCNTSIPVECG